MADDNTRSYIRRGIRTSTRVRMSKRDEPIKGTPDDSKRDTHQILETPSPIRGKRSQASQLLEGRSTLMKKFKYQKEVTLQIFLPNKTFFKFTVDVASVHSVDALLDLVKKSSSHSQLNEELESALTASIKWDATDVYLEKNVRHQLNNKSLITTMYSVKRGGSIILLLQDGVPHTCFTDIYPSMWNVTFKPEMLRPLPEGCTLDIALVDQVDNALQAVWHSDLGYRRLVSVNLSRDTITIFDTGRGMDATEENSIANWGMKGASTNCTMHQNAMRGALCHLGKYGAGAVASALHLGDRVTIWSKTTQSKKAVCLVLEGKDPEIKELRRQSYSKDLDQQVWKMGGGFRAMTKEELEMAPHGSFTSVEITKLKSQYCLVDNGQQYWEVERVRRTIKNMYFCYIQSKGKSSSDPETTFPVEFFVNGTNLVETKCETDILKQHTCTGDSFAFNICAKRVSDEIDGGKGDGTPMEAGKMEVANARVICNYYPNQKGKESLETALEEIKRLSPLNSMTFEDMPRVDIRWLGRLLPDAKWVFPFMEVPLKMEQKSDFRLWAKRVKASVVSDAGFHPAQSKMELDLDQPFVVALQQIGSESFAGTSALGVDISIKYNDMKISNTELADAYRKWVKDMHKNFDKDLVFADEAIRIFNHGNALKELGWGNKPLFMFHKHMEGAQQDWKIDDQNPIWMHLYSLKVPKYVTLEYFCRAEPEDDDGNKVKFLCRDMEVDAADGCKITFKDGNPHFELNSSECFPAALLGISKRLDATDWKKKREEILSTKRKDYSCIGISKCELKVEITQRTQQYLEDKAKILEGDLKALECRKNVVKASQEEAHDNEILKVERTRPSRTLQTVLQEMRHLAQNGHGAALTFWETQTKASWDKDCVGLVATLAQVESDSLNRMLAEYLGPETLLMIVSRTQQTIDTLARYDAHGNLDESLGLHGFAHSLGYKISGTSTALALSNTRPYRRVHGPPVNMQHPQKILNIDPPSLPGGQIPEGFLGYAVNLLYLSPDQLRISVPTQIPGAFGLRESLFFHLVGTLQVYDTRQHLISAKEKIESWQDAAISLDGGLIKTNQYEYFGKVRETVPIRFGMVPLAAREQLSLMPPACHAFQRFRALSLIDKEISGAQEALRFVKEELDETSMHVKLLKRSLRQARILQQENV